MNATVISSTSSGTSSGGDLLYRSLRVICVAGALSIAGTHSAYGSWSHDPLQELASRTNSGFTTQQTTQAGPAIMELRRLSGMTWEQLAALFGVTRRTLHFWASGKALNSNNEEKLYRVLSTVRQIDRGSARENRMLLFTAPDGGIAPIDLIQAGRYAEAVRLLGEASVERPTLTPLSPEARSRRMPMEPAVLANALQDKIVPGDGGKTRRARAIRVKNKNQGDHS